MRTAKRQNPNKAKVAQSVSIPAPVGGWDAISPLANMPPDAAIILNNFIPRPGYVEVRRGYEPQVTGTSAAVQSLIVYRGLSTGDQLFAAAGGNIYNVTTQGAALGSPVYSGATVATWQYTSFATLAGVNELICVNGTDQPVNYNGSSWSAITFTGSSGSYSLNPNNLYSVTQYMGRLYFIEKNTLHAWFAGVEAVAGTLSILDLSSVFSKGGRLIGCATWSTVYSLALAQYIVFLTDQGQIAIYQGTDPTQAADFALVGVYDLGLPLGPRALVQYGSDLIVITADGVVPMSQAMRLDRSQDDLVSVTQKIQNAFSQAARAYRNNFGWEAILYSGGVETSTGDIEEGAGSLIIVNVPTASLSTSVQFVQNVQTGAWCQFTNLNAFCWALANQNIYFGSTSGVYQWDVGANDNGNVITAEMKLAFNPAGERALNKKFTMIRPLLYCSTAIQPAITIDVDYQNTTPASVPNVVQSGNTTPQNIYDWTSADAIGFVGSPHLIVQIGADTTPYNLAYDSGASDTVSIDGTYTLATQAATAFDVPFQVIAFDLLFEPGDVL